MPLTCRLSESLVSAEEAALRDLVRLQQQRNSLDQPDDSGTDKRRRKRSKSRVLRFLRSRYFKWILVLLTMGATIFFLGIVVAVLVLLAAVVSILIGTVVVLTLKAIGIAMGRVRGRYVRMNQSAGDLEARALHAASEAERLSCLYSQYMYWAQCISEALHRPWGSDSADQRLSEDNREDHGVSAVTLSDFWSEGSHALSLIVALAYVSGEDRNVAALDASRGVIQRGWIARAYRTRRRHWEEDYGPVLEVMNDQLAASPEEDVDADDSVLRLPSVEDGDTRPFRAPLADFAMRYCDGLYSEEYRREVLVSLEKGLRASLKNKIEYVGSDESKMSGMSLREFLAGPIETPSETRLRRYVDAYARMGYRSWYGHSSVESLESLACADRSASRHPVGTFADTRVFVSFKLDVSDAIVLDQCKLVGADEELNSESLPSSSDVSDIVSEFG